MITFSQKADDFTNKGLLLIGQLSSKGNLIDENYTKGKKIKILLCFFVKSCLLNLDLTII